MEFTISKSVLQKELGFVQGIVERKNTIPVLSNILIESVGENTIRIVGTDLDVTIRCDAEAETIKTQGAMCIQARKLFDIVRLLPDESVSFQKEDNNWVSVKCARSSFRLAGVARDQFPEVPSFKSAPMKLSADVFKSFINKTIFAITQEESRYTLSGAKFILDKSGAKMVTTDGHRLAYVEKSDLGENAATESVDTLIPKKTLAELIKLAVAYEGEISFGTDDNHIYFEVGSHLLISRKLSGQFPNYEMVMPQNADKSIVFDCAELNQAIRRVATMADDRTRAIRFQLSKDQVQISSQTVEEGEALETLAVNYDGDEVQVGFNSQYLQDFLNVIGEGQIAFEFKDGNSQAQLRPAGEPNGYDYKYVVMPMRI
jgi:DNA polymerase-3 subunit beta